MDEQLANESLIIIEGEPIAAARPRKGKNGFYNPQRELIDKIKWNILAQKENWQKMFGPLCMFVDFCIGIRKSFSKQKVNSIKETPHSNKPDLSNFIKFIEDVLNGIVYEDDRQIYKIVARKFWSCKPRTYIKIVHYGR